MSDDLKDANDAYFRGDYKSELEWRLWIGSFSRQTYIVDYYQRGRPHQTHKKLPIKTRVSRHSSLSVTQTGQRFHKYDRGVI
jgi:hypothetical protein